MEVNYFGTCNSINSFMNTFQKKKVAIINNIFSMLVTEDCLLHGAYCASKAALTSFAESLNFDYAKKMYEFL